MNQDLEATYRQRLSEHGFSLRKRRDGLHVISRGDYRKMVGDLEKEIEEFIAALGGFATVDKTERD